MNCAFRSVDFYKMNPGGQLIHFKIGIVFFGDQLPQSVVDFRFFKHYVRR